MVNFEWDEHKNKSNLEKHNVTFEEARDIFNDEDSIEQFGKHKGEVRFLRIGKTATKLILLVVYTLRKTVVRIISARQANKNERNAYLKIKLTQQSENDEDHN